MSREEALEALDLVCNVYPDIAPEKYGLCEPLREQFDPSNLEPILQNWRSMLFWKRRKPKVEGMVSPSWGRGHRHGHIGVTIDASNANVSKLVRFVQEASSRLGADFAFMHSLTEPDTLIGRATDTLGGLGRREGYRVLMSGHKLEKYIPDLYWATVFGGVYIEHFGRERLLSAPAHIVKELPGGSIYLQLSESIFDLETDYEKVDAVRKMVKEHLNNNSFFDPNIPAYEYHEYNVPKFRLIPEESPIETPPLPSLKAESEVAYDSDLFMKVQGLCNDAMDFAKETYSVNLDFSEKSVELVEQILGKAYNDLPHFLAMPEGKLELAKEYFKTLSGLMGALIGEVLRRQVGGIWYWEKKAFAPDTLLALRIGNETIFPINKVYKRLTNGPEDDVYFYFKVMKSKVIDQKNTNTNDSKSERNK